MCICVYTGFWPTLQISLQRLSHKMTVIDLNVVGNTLATDNFKVTGCDWMSLDSI